MAHEIRVGMVGYKFMGRAHSHAFVDVPVMFKPAAVPVLQAVCGRDEAGVGAAAAEYGWKSHETDWRTLVARDDVDIVDIATPTDSHAEIAIAAAEHGKHVFCEKPLAMNLAEAKAMLAAAEHGGVKHQAGFNYRWLPAVMLAKRMIAEGRLGTIRHFRAQYLQDWIVDPDFPLVWRLDKSVAGLGVLGDLGSHVIDLARYLVGEITSVACLLDTFIKERPVLAETADGLSAAGGGEERGEVTVDDAALFMARFADGATGSFEVSRLATGRKNFEVIEINGSEGSLAFNLERLNELQYYSLADTEGEQGFRTILATDPGHPFVDHWWPPGHTLGWEHSHVHQMFELCDAIGSDRMPDPSFADGERCQAVLEACAQSAESGQWVGIPA